MEARRSTCGSWKVDLDLWCVRAVAVKPFTGSADMTCRWGPRRSRGVGIPIRHACNSGISESDVRRESGGTAGVYTISYSRVASLCAGGLVTVCIYMVLWGVAISHVLIGRRCVRSTDRDTRPGGWAFCCCSRQKVIHSMDGPDVYSSTCTSVSRLTAGLCSLPLAAEARRGGAARAR